MPHRSSTVTLTGDAQWLGDLVPTGEGDRGLREISLQPGPSNASPVYVGDAAVTNALYSTRLPAASAGIPPAPFIVGGYDSGGVRLGDYYVLGANGETLHIGMQTY